MNRSSIAMLGKQYRRSPFPGRLHCGRVARPFVCLNAMEGLLVLGVGDALRVDRGIQLSLCLCRASSALMDHRDGDVTSLKTGAAGPWGLVMRGSVNLENISN